MSNRHVFPTSLIDVQPGNETGDYHITFCNLALNTTWQEMKDWFSASCDVDFIEVFPSNCSGWMRVKGRDNFERALEHLRNELFRDQVLHFDSRNETQAIKIRYKENSPRPKHARRKRSNRGNPGQKQPCGYPVPQNCHAQSPLPDEYAWLIQSEHVHAAEAAKRRAYEEYLAFASFVYNTRLHNTLSMQYPVSAFPYCQPEHYGGLSLDSYGNYCSPYLFGGSPAVYTTQVGYSGSVVSTGSSDMPDAPENWLGYGDW
ncbi:hypothetical protein HDV57DRAFT_11674 [Trichoderma longibrachiatum]